MSTEEELRLHRCCFSGHRPEKLGLSEQQAKELLRPAIKEAVNDGFSTFLVGMQRGVDIWAGQLVLQQKAITQDIKLVAVVPYKGFESRWPQPWQEQFRFLIQWADAVRYLGTAYDISLLERRNRWMIDRSSRLIAVYNGQTGGTRNAIRYAMSQGLDIRNLLEIESEIP